MMRLLLLGTTSKAFDLNRIRLAVESVLYYGFIKLRFIAQLLFFVKG